MAVRFYRQLFNKEEPDPDFSNNGLLIANPLTAAQAQIISHPFSTEEVLVSLKSMSGWKAPGPDGMPAAFF
ncbi:hypothetical protein, partial [Mycobacterium tuberculosis]